jgi:hypothetical protein
MSWNWSRLLGAGGAALIAIMGVKAWGWMGALIAALAIFFIVLDCEYNGALTREK